MPIRILPARLANQIAAGEVVERPASVVKELVENSLDAGATKIEIELEKGGSKRICIRDNGAGIAKDELELALSRHATSKIATLDDLEAIMSLGFRGEALASISSVSRLTLTSRTAEQPQAWSACAQGRDMAVTLKPAAHPIGTSIEVLDLFFNTPARRRFLRTDKTEFSHIDELVKRIALSRFDITIILKHNGAIVRQYAAAATTAQRDRRLSAICGSQFMQHAIAIELEHQGVSLSGWIGSPQGARPQNDIQHCFVNQRMMKDKLINHAIRQGYESSLAPEQFAAYVLYIEIDPQQVDVNVHPAKHEVRFHQARWVHDFIYQAVNGALHQAQHTQVEIQAQAEALISSIPPAPTEHTSANQISNKAWHNAAGSVIAERHLHDKTHEPRAHYQSAAACTARPAGQVLTPDPASLQAQQRIYQQLMTASEPEPQIVPSSSAPLVDTAPTLEAKAAHGMGKPLAVINAKYLLLLREQNVWLVDLAQANQLALLGRFRPAIRGEGLKAQPLLIPQQLSITPIERQALTTHQGLLLQFGIVLKEKSKHQLLLMAVCQPLRQQNLAALIPNLLAFVASLASTAQNVALDVANWIVAQILPNVAEFELSQAINLICELEDCWQTQLTTYYSRLMRQVNVTEAIAAFREHEQLLA